MKKLISTLLIIISFVLLNGCAAGYKAINPPTINYSNGELQNGISFSYKHDVLREKGNKRYAKKEDKKGIRLIAIKITNNTDSILNVSNDITFYSEGNKIFPLEPMTIKNSLKQSVPSYLLYLLLTPVKLFVTSSDQTVKTYPIGYGLGPGITAGNMATAGSSNSKLQKELFEHNIMNKNIPIGETTYGIIGVRDLGYNPITIKLNKK